jgi:hypothetical protein
MSSFVKPALQLAVGGTLSFDVPEGAPASGTVVVKDYNGTTIVASTAATVTTAGGITTLSYAAGAAAAPLLGENYRAEWTYTVGSTPYTRPQLFDVVANVLYPTLSTTKLTTVHARLLSGRFPAGVTSFANEIALAWGDVQKALRGYGKNPNKIIDPAPLEDAHAHFAAARIASSYQPGNATAGEWQQWAEMRYQQARAALDLAMADLAYDADQSGTLDVAEAHTAGRTFRLSR